MEKLITICVALMILAVSTVGQAGITDDPNYVPSSNLVLGPYVGTKGWQLAQAFQLNLVYQTGIPNSDIDAFNAYDPDGWLLNFSDEEYYYLKVDPVGGLPIGVWDFENGIQYYAPDSGQSWVKWTLSYHGSTGYQTILAGDIIDDPYLHVRPTAGYRSFVGDAVANYVEVFDGDTIQCEVLGYVYSGTLDEGVVLSPKLIPAPGAILLGSIGVGLVGWLRKRRTL